MTARIKLPCPHVAEGSELRKIREAAGVTLTTFAEDIGYSRYYLSNIERGFNRASDTILTAYRLLRERVTP